MLSFDQILNRPLSESVSSNNLFNDILLNEGRVKNIFVVEFVIVRSAYTNLNLEEDEEMEFILGLNVIADDFDNQMYVHSPEPNRFFIFRLDKK